MWGIEFRGNTSSGLIYAEAEFEARYEGGLSRLFRVRWYSDRMAIDEMENHSGEWKVVKHHAENADLEAILPKAKDFGHDWTVADLMIAMMFYGEGHKRGYSKGRYDRGQHD